MFKKASPTCLDDAQKEDYLCFRRGWIAGYVSIARRVDVCRLAFDSNTPRSRRISKRRNGYSPPEKQIAQGLPKKEDSLWLRRGWIAGYVSIVRRVDVCRSAFDSNTPRSRRISRVIYFKEICCKRGITDIDWPDDRYIPSNPTAGETRGSLLSGAIPVSFFSPGGEGVGGWATFHPASQPTRFLRLFAIVNNLS